MKNIHILCIALFIFYKLLLFNFCLVKFYIKQASLDNIKLIRSETGTTIANRCSANSDFSENVTPVIFAETDIIPVLVISYCD